LWKESPHAWGQDNGVDLTAEDEDGAIWAIQAKAWHPNKKLTKGEIDSFLAESSRESIDFRLIVSTAKGMTKQLEQAIFAQEKEVKVILGHDLAKSRAPWKEAKLFSNKKFQIGLTIVLFLVILISSTSIRLSNLPALVDQTTGLYTSNDLDSLYFYRMAETQLELGYLPEVDAMRAPGYNSSWVPEIIDNVLIWNYKILNFFKKIFSK
jgi:hypothetical protein